MLLERKLKGKEVFITDLYRKLLALIRQVGKGSNTKKEFDGILGDFDEI